MRLMRLITALVRRFPVTVLSLMTVASLLLTLACSSGPAPTPTPTPIPAPPVDEILSAVGQGIAGMSTAKIGMVDETESGAKFFGTTFKGMEAEVEAPNSFRMVVDVVSPNFGFVQIEIVKVGEQAVMKFSQDAPWTPLPPSQVPFDFGGLTGLFSDLPAVVQDVAVTGLETVQGTETIRVEGTVLSDALAGLITSADPGHTINLTLWVDPTELDLRQLSIKGQLYDDDAPETVRLITIRDINVPVEIELPQ